MTRSFLIPKPDNVVISVDFGQGEDIAEKVVFRKIGSLVDILSVEEIGKAKDFDTEEKINQYIEKL